MPGITIQILRESDRSDWTYGSNYVDGALRLLSVNDLLPLSRKDGTIVLSEWRDLDLSQKSDKIPKYAAISHSWTPSAEVQRLTSIVNRTLNIDTGPDGPHEISWHGLCQAARAAQHLRCDFLWLDFVCVNQTSSMDKKLQVQNMGHVYSNAEAVIVMPGGVAAAQDAQKTAPWITRAWTLQEATLCPNTHVLILHPELHSWDRVESTGPKFKVVSIEGNLAMSELAALLTCRSLPVTVNKQDRITKKVISAQKFSAGCFGDDENISSALEGIVHTRAPTMKTSAVWRSIWMRTSTKPQDMVFSVMHLLGVRIDVDYSRTVEDLILELARNTTSQPSWLDIGFNMPFEPRYGLVPAIPPFNPNHTPAYIIGDQFVPVGSYVTQGFYVSDFNIKVLASATAGHDGSLICAEIFEIYRDFDGRPSVISGNGEQVYLSSDADGLIGSHVVVLGSCLYYGIVCRAFCPGPLAFQLRKSKLGVWERVGKKIYVTDSFIGVTNRSHLRVGGSPGAEITLCDCP